MRNDRVQDQPRAAGLPFGPRGVRLQSVQVGPGLAKIVTAEQPGRLNAGVKPAVA